jgi:DNA-binding HxlR family transcriptional regulator
MEIVGDKRKIQILLFLLERGVAKKYDFLDLMKNMYMIDKHLIELEKNGYIVMNKIGVTYQISLTEKGKLMAEQLKKMNKLPEEKEEPIAEISKEKYEQMAKDWKRLSALTHVNVLDDHIVLKEYNYDGQGHDRLVTIYVMINHDKVMRLYCDVDQSTTCWHVQYAWTLPEVQAWVQYHLQKGDITRTDNQKEEK